jgi:para-nitrobenzyl esterase
MEPRANTILYRFWGDERMSIQQNVIIDTICGKIEGVFEENLYTFKGIPYAAAPVGDLRWLPPQPAIAWSGIMPAKSFGRIAPQDTRVLPILPSAPEPQSEGCLFLNVFSPGLDSARRPVMVWIHGGAFSIGSGSGQMYSSQTIAANQNIVLVTLNYRLGVLGFLNLNEVTKGRIPSTGNEGLLDQVAALKWVRANIAAFGGDPETVTVFGESAGAMSVGCLLNLPEARGLFHKAIMESPVGEMARPLDMSVRITEEFLRVAGVTANDITGLRSLPIEVLLRAQQETAIRTGQGAAPLIPVADGVVMPRMPLESLEAGLGLSVPTVIGCNLDEDKFFAMMIPNGFKADADSLRKTVSRYVDEKDIEKLIDAYREARAKRGEPTTPFELRSAISTDVMFRKTAIRIAEAQCRHAPGGYHYLFKWKSPAAGGILGSCHVLEIGFVFGNYDAAFNGSGPDADRLSQGMQDAWGTFARTGNPSCRSLGDWPRYSDNRATMVFGVDSRVEKAVYEEERSIWQNVGELKFSNMP